MWGPHHVATSPQRVFSNKLFDVNLQPQGGDSPKRHSPSLNPSTRGGIPTHSCLECYLLLPREPLVGSWQPMHHQDWGLGLQITMHLALLEPSICEKVPPHTPSYMAWEYRIYNTSLDMSFLRSLCGWVQVHLSLHGGGTAGIPGGPVGWGWLPGKGSRWRAGQAGRQAGVWCGDAGPVSACPSVPWLLA